MKFTGKYLNPSEINLFSEVDQRTHVQGKHTGTHVKDGVGTSNKHCSLVRNPGAASEMRYHLDQMS